MLTHRDRFLDLIRNPPSTKEAMNLAARFAIVEYVDEESSETGQDEVYVRPFPNVEEGKWQISISGGREPAWALKRFDSGPKTAIW